MNLQMGLLDDIMHAPQGMMLMVNSTDLKDALKTFAQEIMDETRQSTQNEMAQRKEFYTREEVAKMCNKGIRTIDLWLKNGIISRVKVGRSVLIPRSQIEVIVGMERRN